MYADLQERLTTTIGRILGSPAPTAGEFPESLVAAAPHRLRDAIRPLLPGHVIVAGTMERRLLIVEHETSDRYTFADLSGNPHASREWPAWAREHVRLDTPGAWLSTGALSADGLHRLQYPRILVAALYHPENFPLPRFSLAIHDVARAARTTLSGQVQLVDMQLGASLDDILTPVINGDVDVLGISATFGQHDIMDTLLRQVFALDRRPLVIAGGSLTARNEVTLLSAYPDLLIARGAGEPTMADLIAYLHGDLRRDQIRGIGFRGAPRGIGIGIGVRHTGSATNRTVTDIFPELDLLDDTFAAGGVAQLEASRGCTSTCSFCPRGHKGKWAGAAPDALTDVLEGMRVIFDRHPHVSRTVYLVDEEFIGRDVGAAARAVSVAKTLHNAGFKFESSCRVDQVVHPAHDRAWHVERAAMWRDLLTIGLRRMLFGVESGVTSILERFHKETTATQNALAIRTLSALGVPTRFTYITFDHLMDLRELRDSLAFQGRTDLLLRPLPHLPVETIIDGVRDPAFVAQHSTGKPFYTGISYMAVSMECLTGAPYTRRVQEAGLAGEPDPSMGRVSASYADWRIGRSSRTAQMWVDRNFALDYLLKSLEKVLDGPQRDAVRGVRVVIKKAAYQVLKDLVDLISSFDPEEAALDRFDALATLALDRQREALAYAILPVITATTAQLPEHLADRLRRQHHSWAASAGWRLINSAGPCTT